MSEFLSRDVRAELARTQKRRRRGAGRVRIVADGQEFPVLRRWERGFAVDPDIAPGLRGLVDVYEGARFICKALIVASLEEGGERHYEYKYANRAVAGAPPVDFARDAKTTLEVAPEG